MKKNRCLAILIVIALLLGVTACNQELHATFTNLTPEQVDNQSSLVVYGEEATRESIIYDMESNKLDSDSGLKFYIITFKVLKVIRGDYKEDHMKFYLLDTSSAVANYGKAVLFLTEYKALDEEDIKNLTTAWVPVLPTAYLQNINGKWIMRYDWKEYLASKKVLTSDAIRSSQPASDGSKSASVLGDYEEITQDNLVDALTNMK